MTQREASRTGRHKGFGWVWAGGWKKEGLPYLALAKQARLLQPRPDALDPAGVLRVHVCVPTHALVLQHERVVDHTWAAHTPVSPASRGHPRQGSLGSPQPTLSRGLPHTLPPSHPALSSPPVVPFTCYCPSKASPLLKPQPKPPLVLISAHCAFCSVPPLGHGLLFPLLSQPVCAMPPTPDTPLVGSDHHRASVPPQSPVHSGMD